MTIISEERPSDSPYVEMITHGRTISDGSTIRPAESHWHMVFVTYRGSAQLIVTGPLTTAGALSWTEGAEVLWIKFKLGTFMPHLPVKDFLNVETSLPEAGRRSFWLNGSTWQFPTHENADTFINGLIRNDILVHDPIVTAALQDQLPEMSLRTVRHRFLRATGLTQSHIRQFDRAKRAAALLQQGVSILDTVYESGYSDQPHLTKSLKRFVGKTPAQLLRTNIPE
jgi:AraC-like DNA-binding protein